MAIFTVILVNSFAFYDRDHVHSHTKWLQRSLEWNQKDRGTDLLLRGSEFTIAKDWLAQAQQTQKQPLPTPLQAEFITASQQAIEDTQAAEAKRQAQLLKLEQERGQAMTQLLAQERQNSNRQRIFTMIMGIALLISISLGAFAYQKMNVAREQEETAVKAKEQAEQSKKHAQIEKLRAELAKAEAEQQKQEALKAKNTAELEKQRADQERQMDERSSCWVCLLRRLRSK
jgi:hypothetical protein